MDLHKEVRNSMGEQNKMSYADKPWLKSYKFGPYALKKTLEPYPEIPLYQILYDSAEQFPTRPACLSFGKETRYSELKNYVDRLATGLAALGVKKGDFVATVLPNCLQFLIADMAILRAGATHIPCSIFIRNVIWNMKSAPRKLRPSFALKTIFPWSMP